MTREDPDLAIIERYRAGAASAFDELVKKHEPLILGLVLRYVKNEEDAKDVTQRVFVRAFEKLDTFRGESSFRTWIYRIAVNLSLNHVRGAPQGDAVPLEDVVAFTSSLETSRLMAAEMWRKVSQRLDQLPPTQRLVVELRLFHDLSFKEVAAIADSSEDAAKANFHHGVKSLRNLLPR
jgi:RNA polymerase sigma-70 factor (ECF subfamily)